MITITKTDLETWGSSPVSLKWFNETFPQGEATLDQLVSLCPNKRWLAWVCCHAALNLPDSQFDPALIDTLIKIGNAHWIAWAAKNLSDARFNPELIPALVKIGDTYWLAWTARWLSDARFDPALIDALIKTGDAYWLAWAAIYLSEFRYNPALIPALIKTGNAYWIAWAVKFSPNSRKKLLQKEIQP